jgi:hypothetical protein
MSIPSARHRHTRHHGSAVPADDITRHTGAGRITRLRMRPMTPFEVGRASGEISLAGLLARDPARATDSGLTVADVALEIAPRRLARFLPPAARRGAARRAPSNHPDHLYSPSNV